MQYIYVYIYIIYIHIYSDNSYVYSCSGTSIIEMARHQKTF